MPTETISGRSPLSGSPVTELDHRSNDSAASPTHLPPPGLIDGNRNSRNNRQEQEKEKEQEQDWSAREGGGGNEMHQPQPQPQPHLPASSPCGIQAQDAQMNNGSPPPTATASTTSVTDLAVEAAMSLESLAWGNHPQSSTPMPSAAVLALLDRLRKLVSADQMHEILQFHKHHVAWMHNVVYMPFFVRECDAYLTGRLQRDSAWLSLYCAVLCTGIYYMSPADHVDIGLENGFEVSKKIYHIAIEIIMKSDFMVHQSLYSLQAICILILCAHAFGDTRRIKVLLSCANTMGQGNNHRLHYLGSVPSSHLAFEEMVDLQVQKRVWCFLSIQDWYLIASKKAYSISPHHGLSSLPANCQEDFDDVMQGGALEDLPLSVYTQSTYMLFLYQLTTIYRTLFDQLNARPEKDRNLDTGFALVLEADAKLESTMGAIEQASAISRASLALPGQSPEVDGGDSDTNQRPPNRHRPFLAAQWKALVITSWHQRVMIHRSFFCRSFHDKRFHFSRFVCLAAARKILRSYLDASSSLATEIWSIPTHAISACIVVTLNALFTAEQYTLERGDLDLMYTCLAALKAAPRPNTIVDRGVQIVQRLLNQQGSLTQFRKLDPGEISQLAQDIEGPSLSGIVSGAWPQQPMDIPSTETSSQASPMGDDTVTPHGHFVDDELFMPWWHDLMTQSYSL